MKTVKRMLALLFAFMIAVTAAPVEAQAASVVKPSLPKSVTVYDVSADSCILYWDDVPLVSGYRIYRYENSKWVKLTDVVDSMCYISELEPKTTYKLSVRPYRDVLGKRVYSKSRKSITVKTTGLGDFSSFTVTEKKGKALLQWEDIAGADGYRVYQRKNGKWVKLATGNKKEYYVKNLKAGGTYYFTVRAYAKTKNGTIWSNPAKTQKITMTDPKKVVITSADAGETSVVLKWKKAADATGYRVYQYKNKKWTTLKTTKSLTYTAKKLKANTSYSFRVRAYKKVNGKTSWYPVSETLKVTTLPTLKNRNEVCELYNTAVNNLKSYKGKLTVTHSTKMKFDVDPSVGAAKTLIQNVISSFEEPTTTVTKFNKGVDSNGARLTDCIYPLGKKASLEPSALYSAKIKTNSDKTKEIQFKLIEEKYVFDGKTVTVTPKHHASALYYLDIGSLDIGPVTFKNAEGVYPGTTVKIKLDAKGRLISFTMDSPSQQKMQGGMSGIDVSLSMDAQINESFKFAYK